MGEGVGGGPPQLTNSSLKEQSQSLTILLYTHCVEGVQEVVNQWLLSLVLHIWSSFGFQRLLYLGAIVETFKTTCYICIYSFKPHNNLVKEVSLLSPFYRWRN